MKYLKKATVKTLSKTAEILRFEEEVLIWVKTNMVAIDPAKKGRIYGKKFAIEIIGY